MLLNVNSSIATFGNTPKVDTKATNNEYKKKNQLIMVYNDSNFKKEKKRKEKDIKLRGS